MFSTRAVFAAVASGVLITAMVSEVANADPAPAAAECPDPFPLDDVSAGMAVTGLTVSKGTTPDEFTGSIVGTIGDGIAPGLDMIIAKLAGSEITDPDTGDVRRGIWAGMSGSPVYAANGQLIGAVAYGLSNSPSDYAGITPAAEMYRVRDYEPAQAPLREPSRCRTPWPRRCRLPACHRHR